LLFLLPDQAFGSVRARRQRMDEGRPEQVWRCDWLVQSHGTNTKRDYEQGRQYMTRNCRIGDECGTSRTDTPPLDSLLSGGMALCSCLAYTIAAAETAKRVGKGLSSAARCSCLGNVIGKDEIEVILQDVSDSTKKQISLPGLVH
jgi:hypothetical protein